MKNKILMAVLGGLLCVSVPMATFAGTDYKTSYKPPWSEDLFKVGSPVRYLAEYTIVIQPLPTNFQPNFRMVNLPPKVIKKVVGRYKLTPMAFSYDPTYILQNESEFINAKGPLDKIESITLSGRFKIDPDAGRMGK